MAICAGEETGCEGSYHLAEIGALGEAGAIVIAEPTSNYPILGHKGALWLKVETEGITSHGSMPEHGDNAIYKAARSVTKLEEFDFNVMPHELLGRSTLNVGTMQGGLNLNSVPDHAEFTIDIRTLPEQNPRRDLLGPGGVSGRREQDRPRRRLRRRAYPAHPSLDAGNLRGDGEGSRRADRAARRALLHRCLGADAGLRAPARP